MALSAFWIVDTDCKCAQELIATTTKPSSLRRENAPEYIRLPVVQPQGPLDLTNDDDSMITPRPTTNAMIHPALTPGLSIGAATPYTNGGNFTTQIDRPDTAEEGSGLEKRVSQHSQHRTSTDRKSGYFSSDSLARSPVDGLRRGLVTPGDASLEGATLTSTQSPSDGDRDEKTREGGLFGKSFRMKFPKKLGRPSTEVKSAIVDETSEGSDKSEEKEDKSVQDNFYGTIQKIRYEYEARTQHESSQRLVTGIESHSPTETPKLLLPPYTTVIIQDEQPDSGGVADLYRGTVSSVGSDADIIEKVAPMWLGELLLKVRVAIHLKAFSQVLTVLESNAYQGHS